MLDEHKMFEKFRGGETSKQGQAHVRQTTSVIFARPHAQGEVWS